MIRLTLLTILSLGISQMSLAQDWGTMATISSTMGVNANRICIGESSRSDIGCPTYAPSVSPTGTFTVDNVSLTTASITWGYLASSLSFLPNISANTISTTNISVTTINGVAASSLGGGGAMPTGAVVGFNLAACPSGWSEYTSARGRFLRGIDSTGTNDPDGVRTLGSIQADANKSHTHTGTAASAGAHTHDVQVGAGTQSITRVSTASNFSTVTTMSGAALSAGAHTHTLTINADGATEARPKNVAVLFCQKD